MIDCWSLPGTDATLETLSDSLRNFQAPRQTLWVSSPRVYCHHNFIFSQYSEEKCNTKLKERLIKARILTCSRLVDTASTAAGVHDSPRDILTSEFLIRTGNNPKEYKRELTAVERMGDLEFRDSSVNFKKAPAVSQGFFTVLLTNFNHRRLTWVDERTILPITVQRTFIRINWGRGCK